MIKNNLVLREANMNDAKMLFDWRNDPETRRQSVNSGELDWNTHISWLEKVINNPKRHLMVAMMGGENVGTIRFDIEDPYSELSWTVAPEARGKGVGTKMVEEAVRFFKEPLIAKIKPENIASIKIAENSGFQKKSENKEITEWVLDR